MNRITNQDIKDSFNIFAPKKSIKAKLKIMFVLLPIILVLASLIAIIESLTGIRIL